MPLEIKIHLHPTFKIEILWSFFNEDSFFGKIISHEKRTGMIFYIFSKYFN